MWVGRAYLDCLENILGVVIDWRQALANVNGREVNVAIGPASGHPLHESRRGPLFQWTASIVEADWTAVVVQIVSLARTIKATNWIRLGIGQIWFGSLLAWTGTLTPGRTAALVAIGRMVVEQYVLGFFGVQSQTVLVLLIEIIVHFVKGRGHGIDQMMWQRTIVFQWRGFLLQRRGTIIKSVHKVVIAIVCSHQTGGIADNLISQVPAPVWPIENIVLSNPFLELLKLFLYKKLFHWKNQALKHFLLGAGSVHDCTQSVVITKLGQFSPFIVWKNSFGEFGWEHIAMA